MITIEQTNWMIKDAVGRQRARLAVKRVQVRQALSRQFPLSPDKQKMLDDWNRLFGPPQ